MKGDAGREKEGTVLYLNRSILASWKSAKAVNKACGILGFINRSKEYKRKKEMVNVCKTVVVLQLVYCVQLWSPLFRMP